MTTVAALVRDGVVHMAADSLTNVYDRPIVDGARKVRRLNAGDSTVLLALSGDGGLADLAQDLLHIDGDPAKADDLQGWASQLARDLTGLAMQYGHIEGGHLDGGGLLGARGRLWHIAHGQAIPLSDGVAALGSGEGPAIGALDVLRCLPDVQPADAVERAVRIACERDKHSAPPVYVHREPQAPPPGV